MRYQWCCRRAPLSHVVEKKKGDECVPELNVQPEINVQLGVGGSSATMVGRREGAERQGICRPATRKKRKTWHLLYLQAAVYFYTDVCVHFHFVILFVSIDRSSFLPSFLRHFFTRVCVCARVCACLFDFFFFLSFVFASGCS